MFLISQIAHESLEFSLHLLFLRNLPVEADSPGVSTLIAILKFAHVVSPASSPLLVDVKIDLISSIANNSVMDILVCVSLRVTVGLLQG